MISCVDGEFFLSRFPHRVLTAMLMLGACSYRQAWIKAMDTQLLLGKAL